jgi:gluconate 2-dehydrogenase gamma chain
MRLPASDAAHSRRQFLARASGALGSTWLALNLPRIAEAAHAAHDARAQSLPLTQLQPADAADVEAIAAQIVPSDDTPGAREAGVIEFIDRALGGFYGGHAAEFRQGLAAFQHEVRQRHPGATAFSALPGPDQVAFLRSVEQGEFFQAVRLLVILGLFAMPSYGGNRNRIGWDLVGFEDTHVYAPPFGYYDRDYPGFAATSPPEAK